MRRILALALFFCLVARVDAADPLGDIPANVTVYTAAEVDALIAAVPGVPAGTVTYTAANLAPTGWLLCDGTSYLRASFPDLFTAIGTQYGSVDGTHFNVPNLTGRVVVTIDSGDTDFDTRGETRGAKTVASAGSNSAPTFTGSALGTHSHGTGTYATSAHVGTAVADHPSHTHNVTSNVTVADHASHTHTYTEVPNHVHVQHTNTATTGSTGAGVGAAVDASTSGDSTCWFSTSNPTGGVATGTTNGPSATLTHAVTNNTVASGNNSVTLTHTVTPPNAHTLSGDSEAVSAGTPAGTVSAPTFTGSATSVVQPCIVLNAIIKQ